MKKFTIVILLSAVVCMNAQSGPLSQQKSNSPQSAEMIRSNLNIVAADGTATLVDGDLTQYDPSYSNAVDGMDARKMDNFSENIGMIREKYTLVIERRHTIENNDSIFYKIWNLSQSRSYQLEFITSNLNHPGLIGYLRDKYLNTNTVLDLNGTNHINFTINTAPASFDPLRFTIIFATAAQALLPLTFTSVNATENNNVVNIDWGTKNESGIQAYNIERSPDGNNFQGVGAIQAHNQFQGNYLFTDKAPLSGNNYYRIQSTAIDGQTKYSTVLKVCTGKCATAIIVFPNPVINNTVKLQMMNQPAGNYTVRLISAFGQVLSVKQLSHQEGANESFIPSVAVPKGLYQLEVTGAAGNKATIQVIF